MEAIVVCFPHREGFLYYCLAYIFYVKYYAWAVSFLLSLFFKDIVLSFVFTINLTVYWVFLCAVSFYVEKSASLSSTNITGQCPYKQPQLDPDAVSMLSLSFQILHLMLLEDTVVSVKQKFVILLSLLLYGMNYVVNCGQDPRIILVNIILSLVLSQVSIIVCDIVIIREIKDSVTGCSYHTNIFGLENIIIKKKR